MNVLAKFDEIPSMILQDIKETKRNRHTHTHTHTVGRTDNVKTVYPPTNTVFGGYNEPHREKTCLWDFRPGLTQIRLYSQRRWLEA